MTTISYKHSGNDFSLVIKGHAGYNPGNDIVCAACSALAYTAAENILRFKDIKQSVNFDDGLCEITVTAEKATTRKRIKNIFDIFMRGYNLIARTYPDNVKIIF